MNWTPPTTLAVVGSSHRGVTVEPVNGHLKDRHQLRQFSCRGIKAAQAEAETCHRNRQPAQDLAQPELIKASRKSRGHYGPTPASAAPLPADRSTTNPTASATCADRPKPTFMLVSTGLSPKLIFTGTLRPAMTTTPTLRPKVDQRLRAGAIAFGLAALMSIPSVFSVHPPTDPAHNREFALGANSASFRLATSLGVYALTLVILGMFALYAIVARTRARRSALVGLVVFVVGAGCLLPGTGYATFMMPAAGILISQGHDQEVLLLFDQVFAEPGWIPVFLGGITYHIGLLVMSVAVWRSGTLSKWTAALLAAAALVGLATFMDVVALARVGAVLWIAAFTALAVDVWRNSQMP
jgi:hypothetical protein